MDRIIHRIEVAFKQTVKHPESLSIKKRIVEDLNYSIHDVDIINVYTIQGNVSNSELHSLGKSLFTDQVIQTYSLNKSLAKKFDWMIEVGFKPGVTDNVGHSASEAIKDILGISCDVYTSKRYLLRGKITGEKAEVIASEILANTLIERCTILNKKEFAKGTGIIPPPVVYIKNKPHVEKINLDISDNDLLRLSKERLLALSLEEMKAISTYYTSQDLIDERKEVGLTAQPTDVEIEVLAQTWSEHCKHKIFNARIEYIENGKQITINSLFDTFIKRSTKEIGKKVDWLVSVFTDNAGIIKFNDKWNIVMKVETHNSPSALDPFGGAVTGILGVNRDVAGTGIGAKILFNTDVFCFASPFYNKPLPPRLMPPRRIFAGVRKGVEFGGNTTGVPTINGSIVFDDRFLGKPLVFCGTGGIMPAVINGTRSHLKKISDGDLAVMCGGRIGKDGIHGATFSSEELHEGSPVSAVQIGDPITQKKMLDALLEARDFGLYKTLTDNGAGGLSSSIGELAQIVNGCKIYLDKCPVKYPHLNPWEILVSESQERMTVVVQPDKVNQFLKLLHSRGVEAGVVAEFTSSGKFHALYKNKTVAYLDMQFLHKGVPQLQLSAKWNPVVHPEPEFEVPANLQKTLRNLLSRLNICSKESIVRQYDHEVQATSVIKPMQGIKNDGPGDASVIKPLTDSNEGVIVAHGICPRYGDIDTYAMTACAIDEAIRNAVAVGGSLQHLAGLDNFCWCDPIKSEKNPDGEFKLAQLVRANQALYDYSTAFGVPCISGKDSMKNDYIFGDVKISIPPTLLFSVMGKIEDVNKSVTMDVKKSGDLVYVLGLTKNEMGGSEYYALNGCIGNSVPTVDAKSASKLYVSLSKCISKGLVASCHDCSDGGLGVALAESAIAGRLGMDIDLRNVITDTITRSDYLLFSESQSRFVVTIHPEDKPRFERLMKGNIYSWIGMVRNDTKFILTGSSGTVELQDDVSKLTNAWQKTLKD